MSQPAAHPTIPTDASAVAGAQDFSQGNDGPSLALPESMPYADFAAATQGRPDLAEALSPGITGPNAHRNIKPGRDGRPHVAIKPKSIPPSFVDQKFAEYAARHVKTPVQQAAEGIADGKPPAPKLVPIGEMIRRYGVDTVNTMYPGIFAGGNGYLPYLKRYGTTQDGQLQVPDPTAYNDAFQQANAAHRNMLQQQMQQGQSAPAQPQPQQQQQPAQGGQPQLAQLKAKQPQQPQPQPGQAPPASPPPPQQPSAAPQGGP